MASTNICVFALQTTKGIYVKRFSVSTLTNISHMYITCKKTQLHDFYNFCFAFWVAVHGNWSKWDEWSQCSETCGNGTKSRKRYCTNPAPYNGGKFCTGNNTEVTHCNVKECPGWFEFQGWNYKCTFSINIAAQCFAKKISLLFLSYKSYKLSMQK